MSNLNPHMVHERILKNQRMMRSVVMKQKCLQVCLFFVRVLVDEWKTE